MSWQPATDPILGDKRSCDALELVVVPRVRDLGGFQVRRALPHAKRQMVGPFIFFDQMGPVQLLAGQGMDVRPHPHIGLATVTYLFDGRVMHRDSEGNALEITPGAMNLMTAGRGIAHSERTPDQTCRTGGGMYGIQSWIALPADAEEIAPSFQHFDAATLPVVEDSRGDAGARHTRQRARRRFTRTRGHAWPRHASAGGTAKARRGFCCNTGRGDAQRLRAYGGPRPAGEDPGGAATLASAGNTTAHGSLTKTLTAVTLKCQRPYDRARRSRRRRWVSDASGCGGTVDHGALAKTLAAVTLSAAGTAKIHTGIPSATLSAVTLERSGHGESEPRRTGPHARRGSRW